MANRAARHRVELEEMYMGTPDDSVDLSFSDMPSFEAPPPPLPPAEKTRVLSKVMSTIQEELAQDAVDVDVGAGAGDFSVAAAMTREQLKQIEDELNYRIATRHGRNAGGNGVVIVVGSGGGGGFGRRSVDDPAGARRRQGIPHSNICALCCSDVFVFRHRCLVCGRMYCRHCVMRGMGEMTEGRKCIQCLGRRFSESYIHKAGQTSYCCCWWKYPDRVRVQELLWAEKGPRRSRGGDGRHDVASVTLRSMSASAAIPVTPNGRYHIGNTLSPVYVATAARAAPRMPTYSLGHYPAADGSARMTMPAATRTSYPVDSYEADLPSPAMWTMSPRSGTYRMAAAPAMPMHHNEDSSSYAMSAGFSVSRQD